MRDSRGIGGLGPDIFSGQPADPDLLAALYDLEHEEQVEDQVFYREMARRAAGDTLDLGCGSGRLFRSLVDGGARRLVGVDGSPALLRRAATRAASDPVLAQALAKGRLSLVEGDVRRPPLAGRFDLAVCAGVIPHLDGPEEALRLLGALETLLAPAGVAVLDQLGPGSLPTRDLPLSVDWTREMAGHPVVRRSQMTRREAPEGLRVAYSTLTDTVRPDGTIARLPASFRLWYPYPAVLVGLVNEAGLMVEATYGSHDLEPLGRDSERCIIIVRRRSPHGTAGGQRARRT
jgi:SAM-dependent methyltransferase